MFARSAAELSAAAIAQQGIQTFTFTRHAGRWHMALPQTSGKYLVLGDEEWLHLLAGRRTKLALLLDSEPFEGAEVLTLDELCTGPEGGAYYILHTYGGRLRNRRIWICDISLCIFGDLPPFIYFKRVISKPAANPSGKPGTLTAQDAALT